MTIVCSSTILGRSVSSVVRKGTLSNYPVSVAVKVVALQNSGDCNEAKNLSKLEHPNVVKLYSFEDIDSYR